MFDFNPEIMVSLIIVALVAFAAIKSARANAPASASDDALKEDVNQLKLDVRQIKTELDDAPTAADVAKLNSEVTGMRREMALVAKSADRTEEAVVRIESHLMNHGAASGRRK
jgi:type II secretory pathway pseudopilin PulG